MTRFLIRWMIRGHWTGWHISTDGKVTVCGKRIPNGGEKETHSPVDPSLVDCKRCKNHI